MQKVTTEKLLVICQLGALLLLTACPSPFNKAQPEEEGDSCTATNPCPAELMCVDGYCRKICTENKDCAKKQICDDNFFCMPVPNPLCTADADCQTPGICEIVRDAYCEGARCHYKPKAQGEPCSDDDVCTENDACNSYGKCVGTPIACNTPNESYCSGDDTTYNVFTAHGTCERANNRGCVYEVQAIPCPNCRKECAETCKNVTCEPISDQCKFSGCDSASTDEIPCSIFNKADGTSCLIIDDGATENGVCNAGGCVECTKNEHCTFSGAYPGCYTASCVNNHCQYAFNEHGTCGDHYCLDGEKYGVGLCLQDSTNGTVTCDILSRSCKGYICADSINCRTDCSEKSHCMAGYECIDGACKKGFAYGHTCTAGTDCASGICSFDGHCCNDLCKGACQSCSSGTCKTLDNGDPGNCGANSCCKDGSCVSDTQTVCMTHF